MYAIWFCSLFCLVGVDANAGTVGLEPRRPGCRPGSIHYVRLPVRASVDEIRVIVASQSPDLGAMTVRVGDGRYDRVIHVRGAGSRGLAFSPALSNATFRVALEPGFGVSRWACIEQVQLLMRGTPVAIVTP